MNREKVSKTKRAGLLFPVGRIERKLKKGNYSDRISPSASVFLAGVLEYLSAEVLELAGNATLQNNKKRIIPRHVMQAVKNDQELAELLRNVHFSAAGVMLDINPILLPENSKQKKLKNGLDAFSQEAPEQVQEQEEEYEELEGEEEEEEEEEE